MVDIIKTYGLIFIVSFAITVFMLWLAVKSAYKLGVVDEPGLHKSHDQKTPLLGGLAIFIGITLAMIFFSTLSIKLISLLAGALILVITGLVDDIRNITALQKLTGQVAAASVVVLFNQDSLTIFSDFFTRLNFPGSFYLFLLIGWIVLMINAFNLIDGLDGLAAGTAAIIFAAMAVINYMNFGSANILVLQVISTGACVAFLFFNFNPARIFMGDTGSMLLGYLLTISYLFSLEGNFGGSLVLASIFIFAYPAVDVTFAILRRLNSRNSIFEADRAHIHHILLSLGLSVRRTVLTIYLFSAFFAVMAVIMLSIQVEAPVIITIGTFTLIGIIILYKRLLAISKLNGLENHS